MAWASVNCSRNHGSIIAVSSGRPHVFTLYQRGLGQEPVTVAGSNKSLVAVNAIVFVSVGEALPRRAGRRSITTATRQNKSPSYEFGCAANMPQLGNITTGLLDQPGRLPSPGRSYGPPSP